MPEYYKLLSGNYCIDADEGLCCMLHLEGDFTILKQVDSDLYILDNDGCFKILVSNFNMSEQTDEEFKPTPVTEKEVTNFMMLLELKK